MRAGLPAPCTLCRKRLRPMRARREAAPLQGFPRVPFPAPGQGDGAACLSFVPVRSLARDWPHFAESVPVEARKWPDRRGAANSDTRRIRGGPIERNGMQKYERKIGRRASGRTTRNAAERPSRVACHMQLFTFVVSAGPLACDLPAHCFASCLCTLTPRLAHAVRRARRRSGAISAATRRAGSTFVRHSDCRLAGPTAS